jgi:DnaJ-class molecular chaperone
MFSDVEEAFMRGLFDDGRRTAIPLSAYDQQAKIPKKDRCPSCDGLGWICTVKGLIGPSEYRQCWRCGGNGKKKK